MNGVSYIIIACYPDKGMKSYGSKSLIDFNKKKLLQHQIDIINNYDKSAHEIIVISNFETQKLNKYFGDKIKIISLNNNNPVFQGCEAAKYSQAIFIDYGCIFNGYVFKKMQKISSVVCVNSTKTCKLDVGCLVENDTLKHIFLDLPDNRFCNVFSLCEKDKSIILQNNNFGYFNLLSFEIINMLIDNGSTFKVHNMESNNFLYFNNMRQKNAVTKFIKKING